MAFLANFLQCDKFLLGRRGDPQQRIKPVDASLNPRQSLKGAAFVLETQVLLLHQVFDMSNNLGQSDFMD